MMTVDLDQADLPLAPLLAAVEDRGEVVVLCRAGRAVAELRAVGSAPLMEDDDWSTALPEPDPAAMLIDPLQQHPELAGKILYDPNEPASEDEWPSESATGSLWPSHLPELDPAARLINPLQQHPELVPIIMRYDPTEPATEDEWPSECC